MAEDGPMKKVIPGKESSLPNPYSKHFDRSEDSISLSKSDTNHLSKIG